MLGTNPQIHEISSSVLHVATPGLRQTLPFGDSTSLTFLTVVLLSLVVEGAVQLVFSSF